MADQTTVFEQIPDIGPLLTLRDEMQTGLGGLLDAFPSDPNTLLGALPEAVTTAHDAIPGDPSSLTSGLSTFISRGASMLPAGSLAEVDDLLAGLVSIQTFISEHPIGGKIGAGGNLRQIADVLREEWDQSGVRGNFTSQVQGLIGNVLPVESLQTLTDFIHAVEGMERGVPTDPEALLVFLTQHIFGLPGSILAGPWAVINAFLGHFDDLITGVVPGSVTEPASHLSTALDTAAGRLTGMAPDDAAAYPAVLDTLTQARTHLVTVQSGIDTAITVAGTATSGMNIDGLQADLEAALRDVPPLDVQRLEDVRAVLLQFLEELIEQVQALDAGQAVDRLAQFNAQLEATLSELGLQTAQEAVLKLFRDLSAELGKTEQLIEPVKDTVHKIIQDIQTAITDTGVDRVKADLQDVFDQIKAAIEAINLDEIVGLLEDGLRQIIDLIDGIPLEALADGLDTALERVKQAVDELAQAAGTAIREVNGALTSIGRIDLDSVAQPVIDEINDMKASLRTIDPDRLSEAERAAFVLGTTVLQEIEFKDLITDPLLALYDEIAQPIVEGLEEILGKLTAVVELVLAFDPETLLQPLLQPYAEIFGKLDQLQAEQLIEPIRQKLDKVVQSLEQQVGPETLFQPLQQGYDQFMAAFETLSPEGLRAPLDVIYDTIEELLDKIDLSPVFDQITQLETELFDEVKSLVLGAIDDLNLPEPLPEFLTSLVSLIDVLSPATIRDPAAALESLGSTVAGSFRPGDMLAPLEGLYQRLLAALDTIPTEQLLAAFTRLRDELGHGLDLIDPDNLAAAVAEKANTALATLDQVDPQALITSLSGGHGALVTAYAGIDASQVPPELRPQYQQIGLLITQLEPSLALGGQTGGFTSVCNRLSGLAAGIDLSGLAHLVDPLRAVLNPLVPDFLRDEISLGTIRNGLQALSPASIAEEINATFDALLDAVTDLQAAVQPAVMNLLNTVKKHLLFVDPAGWKDAFEQIKTEILAVFEQLSPTFLVDEFQELFNALKSTLDSFNPQTIIEGVGESFDAALDIVRDLDLSPLTERLNQLLTVLESKLKLLDPQKLQDLLKAIFNEVRKLVEALDVKRLLESFQRVLTDFHEELEQMLNRAGSAFDALKQELGRIGNRIGSPLGTLSGLSEGLPIWP
jgi:hypothetical protein